MKPVNRSSKSSAACPFLRFLMVAVSSLGLLASSIAAQEAPERSKHSDYTRSVLVEVPVSVTQGGAPVRGLTAADFKLLDRGKAVDIVGLSIIDLKTTVAAQTSRPPAGMSMASRRHFLLLFDMSNSQAKSIARARSAVAEWLEFGLHPWDLVGVATYSQRTGARLLLNFTSDFEQVNLAVESLGIPEFVETSGDPLALEIGLPGTNRAVGLEFGVRPPKSGAEQIVAADRYESALQDIYFGVYERMTLSEQRHKVTDFTKSLGELAGMLESRRGRKHVLLFSEGLDRDLIFATDDNKEVQRMNFELESGRLEVVDTNRRYGNSTAISHLNQLMTAFQRADCSVQSLQIGTSGGDSTRGVSERGLDSLYALSHGTGGEVFRNYDRLDESLEDVLDRTSVTYVLSFYPSDLGDNGAFNRLKVKLRDKKRGMRVTHRPGYFEPKPYSATTVAERKSQAAERIMEGVDAGPLDSSLLAVPFYRADRPAYVPFLIEIPGASLPIGANGVQSAVELYVYAIDSSGTIHDFVSQQLNVESKSAAKSLRRTGMKFFGDFELPPGSYTIRALVRETERGLWSTRIADVDIATSAQTSSVLLPPLFPEARGKWLLARETALETNSASRLFPFMLGDQPYLPAVHPTVSAGETRQIVLAGYDFGEGSQNVSARLFDLAGNEVSGAKIVLFERHQDSRLDCELLVGDFSTKRVKAGEYTLAVTVDDPSGQSRTSTLPLRIQSRKRRADNSRAP